MSITVPVPVVRSASPPAPAALGGKAGPIGPGAGPLLTEYLLPTVLGSEPQQKITKALKIAKDTDWIMAAERVIASKIVGCEWHIEDPDGEKIDDDYKGPKADLAKQALDFLKMPQGEIPLKDIGRRTSRRQLLTITSRHMGVAGSAAWMHDIPDGNGIPRALLYIRPDRLTPVCNKAGVLQGWLLDKKPGDPGTPIKIEELRLLQYQPPDVGIFGMGLVEAAIAKAINNGLIDRHFTNLLSSGGRISGIIAPKEGVITDDGVFQQLERDWRNIVEQPEAARRAQIVRAPTDFIQTVMSASEMQVIDLMYHDRDALLALWGVPLSQLGGTVAAGLNSGSTKDKDEAALWQAAVHDRLEELGEATQEVLDLWEPVLGYAPCFCWDEPEFDDETPAVERAQKSSSLPLRNVERRAQMGLEPFGDPGLDNAIWMPVQVVAMAMAPDEETGEIPPPSGVRMVDNPETVPQEPGQMAVDTPATKAPTSGAPGRPQGGSPSAAPPSGATRVPPAAVKAREATGKASAIAPDPFVAPIKARGVIDTGARRLRDNIDRTVVPRLTTAVEAALEDQRDQIAAAVERHWASIVQHQGRDESMWWRPGDVGKPIAAATAGVAEVVSSHIVDVLGRN